MDKDYYQLSSSLVYEPKPDTKPEKIPYFLAVGLNRPESLEMLVMHPMRNIKFTQDVVENIVKGNNDLKKLIGDRLLYKVNAKCFEHHVEPHKS